MADQLCSAAQVKARLFPNGVTDTNDDTLIGELIDQVSGWVQGYCNRKFVPDNAVTYVFDTQAGYVLRIPRGIRAITSMGVNNLSHQPDSGGSYTTVTTADVLLRPKAQDLPEGFPATEIHISRGTLAGTISSFGTIENGCTITGNFGFAAAPQEIASVTIDAVVAAYQSRVNGASSMMGADGGALPPWVSFFGPSSPQRATLNRYRNWSV